jgi:hypothetical protein
MSGWVISAENGIIQTYGNASQFYYFDNSSLQIAHGAIVNFTPNGVFATSVAATGGFDSHPVTLGYAGL